MAKQLLSEELRCRFPPLVVSQSREDLAGVSHTVTEEIKPVQDQTFTSVQLEKPLDTLRPDVVGLKEDLRFLIEIKVAHAVNPKKRATLGALGYPALEIDLSQTREGVRAAELKALVIST